MKKRFRARFASGATFFWPKPQKNAKGLYFHVASDFGMGIDSRTGLSLGLRLPSPLAVHPFA